VRRGTEEEEEGKGIWRNRRGEGRGERGLVPPYNLFS